MKLDSIVGGGIINTAFLAPVPLPVKLLGLYLGGGLMISAGIVKSNLQTEATKAISEMQTAQSIEKITDKIVDGLTPEDEKVNQLQADLAKKEETIKVLKGMLKDSKEANIVLYEAESKKRDAEIARLQAELQKA